MKTKNKPVCAYCDGTTYYAPGTPRPENYCQCSYKHGRMGSSSFSTETTTGRPASDMRKDIMKYLDAMKQDSIVVFKFSVTRLDEEKMEKARVKRQVKKIADRLLGKGNG